jgi:hypothetical protein
MRILCNKKIGQKQRAWRTRTEIANYVEKAAIECPRWTGTEIHRKLAAYIDSEHPELANELPPLRTVQEWVSQCRPPDPSMPWVSTEAPGDEAHYVLKVWAAVMTTHRQQERFTIGEAQRVMWVGQIAPDLPLYYVWLLAKLYQPYDANGWDKSKLDAFLAYQPWKGLDNERLYQEAIQQGWIPDAGLLDRLKDHKLFSGPYGMETLDELDSIDN